MIPWPLGSGIGEVDILSRLILASTILLIARWTWLLLVCPDHLAQFILFGEFPGENTKVSNQLVACSDDRLFWTDLAIRLNTDDDIRNQRMWHLKQQWSAPRKELHKMNQRCITLHTLYPEKRTWGFFKRRERSMLPRVWSSLLKVKMAEEGIPVMHISGSCDVFRIWRWLACIYLHFDFLLPISKHNILIPRLNNNQQRV